MIRKLPIVNTPETVGRPGKGNYPLLCAFHGRLHRQTSTASTDLYTGRPQLCPASWFSRSAEAAKGLKRKHFSKSLMVKI